MVLKEEERISVNNEGVLEKRQPVISAHSICLTAVLAALICILTMVPRIPIPLGYAHLGDAAIFLLVLYAGRRESALAASIGSALADFLGGFPIWILPTLLIKYVMVEIVWHAAGEKPRLMSFRVLAGMLLSAVWMVVGYTLSGALLYGGLATGSTMVPGLVLEGIVNLVAAYAAGIILERSGLFSRG